MFKRIVAVIAVGLVAGAVAVGQVGARDSRVRPALRLVALSPVSVHGRGFGPRERVRVRLLPAAEHATVRNVRASRAGTFSARFAGVLVDRCSAFSVTAVGRSGRRAAVGRRTAAKCPAA